MIIKKHKQAQTLPKASGRSKSDSADSRQDDFLVEDQESESSVAVAPPEDVWTLENLQAGLVNERRQRDDGAPAPGADRRNGYRRIEDRDLISKAHEEANAIRERAESQGFEEGMNRATDVIDELREVIEKQQGLRDQALSSVAREIAGLAMEVAARVIKTEVSCDETLVMAIVRDTIQKASGRGGRGPKSILVKVNPDDVPTVKAGLRADTAELPPEERIGLPQITVMGDSAIEPGSCALETDGGQIDASFQTQLDVLFRLFCGRAYVAEDHDWPGSSPSSFSGGEET